MNAVSFNHTYSLFGPVNTAELTNISTTAIKRAAWGYHVGVEGAYLFTRHVGVGGGLRYLARPEQSKSATQQRIGLGDDAALVDCP